MSASRATSAAAHLLLRRFLLRSVASRDWCTRPHSPQLLHVDSSRKAAATAAAAAATAAALSSHGCRRRRLVVMDEYELRKRLGMLWAAGGRLEGADRWHHLTKPRLLLTTGLKPKTSERAERLGEGGEVEDRTATALVGEGPGLLTASSIFRLP